MGMQASTTGGGGRMQLGGTGEEIKYVLAQKALMLQPIP